jgi:nucleotide-binding universal stress UspA family protein
MMSGTRGNIVNSGYKSILVPYYGQASELGTIDFVSALSREMSAEVTVLYLSRILKKLPDDELRRYRSEYDAGSFNTAMILLDESYQTQLLKDSESARTIAASRFQDHAIPENQCDGPILIDTRNYRWERDIKLETDTSRLLIDKAIAADVLVASYTFIQADGQRDILMGVLKDSGRSIIVVPVERAISEHAPRRIIVAWKQTVHTVRAISEAMPLLQAAHRVLVLEIEESSQPKTERVSASDISRWLSRHGVATESLCRDNFNCKAENVLDEEIARFEADALVMGAYSRSRMREMIFGGFTQHVLDNMKIPTLLAH